LSKAHRRTRFETRIALERMFLMRINEVSSVRLSGMTQAAIQAWENRARNTYDVGIVSKIAGLLLEASARGELLADNSRDVFQPDQRVSLDSLEEVAEILDDVLFKLT
jgi:hypothetical protein